MKDYKSPILSLIIIYYNHKTRSNYPLLHVLWHREIWIFRFINSFASIRESFEKLDHREFFLIYSIQFITHIIFSRSGMIHEYLRSMIEATKDQCARMGMEGKRRQGKGLVWWHGKDQDSWKMVMERTRRALATSSSSSRSLDHISGWDLRIVRDRAR